MLIASVPGHCLPFTLCRHAFFYVSIVDIFIMSDFVDTPLAPRRVQIQVSLLLSLKECRFASHPEKRQKILCPPYLGLFLYCIQL